MGQTVLKLSNDMINKIKQFYEDDLSEKLPPGALFCAKPDGCTVTAYKSGKVLFQGAKHDEEALVWQRFSGDTPQSSPANKPAKVVSNQEAVKQMLSQKSLLGSDEVGTGDYFGPITVVAAFVSKDQMEELTALGVKDSKGMKDKDICILAKKLIKLIPYSLLILHNEKYNSLQERGINQGKMKAMMHNKALLHLKEKIIGKNYDGILIDQFVERNTYFQYIKDQREQANEPNMFFYTKAESLHPSVAAASIIARYAFVKEMDKLSELAGFEIPKGAGSHVDIAAAKLIKEQGIASLNKFCKLHFANTEKAKKI